MLQMTYYINEIIRRAVLSVNNNDIMIYDIFY